MRQLLFRIGITILAFAIGLTAFFIWDGIGLLPHKIQTSIIGSSYSDNLSLRLSANSSILRAGEAPVVQLSITNNGNETVTLVHPGDGSESGWRTPITEWSIISAEDTSQHPSVPDLSVRVRDCGNMNALEWDEVFRLTPGETKEIEYWSPPLMEPGVYRVAFLYANRPSVRWEGMSFGFHNPLAMWRVRHSTECTLVSHEIVFTVNE